MGATLKVKYKFRDGWHVFTADEMPGLYVASMDGEIAFNDVAVAIQKLLKLDYGLDCDVWPQQTFAEFVRENAAPRQTRKTPQAAKPAIRWPVASGGLSDRLFTVCAAAA